MKKYIYFLLLLALFSFCFEPNTFGQLVNTEEIIVLSLNETIDKAISSDLELLNMEFALQKLSQSNIDLYRAFFPKISLNFGKTGSIQLDSIDTSMYSVDIGLTQVLYDQFAAHFAVKNYYLSLQELLIKIAQRKKALEKQGITLYLKMIVSKEQLEQKKEEVSLYAKLMKLLEEETRLGMKTDLQRLESLQKQMKSELEYEEIKAQYELLDKDFRAFIGIETPDAAIEFSETLDEITATIMKNIGTKRSEAEIPGVLCGYKAILFDLYDAALGNNMELQKLKLQLEQLQLNLNLIHLGFLKNISVDLKLSFTGNSFFPANQTTSIGLNLVLDFGIFTSTVSANTNLSGQAISDSQSAGSEVLKTLSPINPEKEIQISLYALGNQQQALIKGIMRALEAFFIKCESQRRIFIIKEQQREIYEKNKILMETKRKTGMALETTLLSFMIDYNKFNLEYMQQKASVIELMYELSDITGISLEELFSVDL